jgi:SAM-dependent methyltransferase
MYLSPEVMVFAPSAIEFLREAHRILRRGGLLLATFPIRYGELDTEIRASIVNGEITHYATPTLLGDPLDNDRPRLVFFLPGWDILEIARAAGFAKAEIVAYSSRTYAILGTEIATVFVLKATA